MRRDSEARMSDLHLAEAIDRLEDAKDVAKGFMLFAGGAFSLLICALVIFF